MKPKEVISSIQPSNERISSDNMPMRRRSRYPWVLATVGMALPVLLFAQENGENKGKYKPKRIHKKLWPSKLKWWETEKKCQ